MASLHACCSIARQPCYFPTHTGRPETAPPCASGVSCIDNFNHHFLHGNGFHDLSEGDTEVFMPGEYFPELIVRHSLDFIGKNRDKPFFLYLALNLPHYPEQALAEHEKLYAHLADPARRSYGAMITTTDHYIGQVVDKLEELGLREMTIVIFMSDNGHSEETSMRIKADGHSSGLPKDHFMPPAVRATRGNGSATASFLSSHPLTPSLPTVASCTSHGAAIGR